MSPSTVSRFLGLVRQHGSVATFHRDGSEIPCPCRTPEGSRDLEWHLLHQFTFLGTDDPPPEPGNLYNAADVIAAINYAEGANNPFQNYQINAMVFQNEPAGLRMYGVIGQLTQGNPVLPDYTDAEAIAWLTATFPTINPAWWVKVFIATDSGFNHTYWLLDPFYAVQQDPAGIVAPPVPVQPHAVLLAGAPMCNAAGMIPDPSTTQDFSVKAFVQPVQSGAVRRLTGEQLNVLFGEVETDDHLGIFPIEWEGHRLEFTDWSSTTKDYILYHGRKFTVVSVNLIPDPADGNPEHHWEVGLRLISGS